MSVFEWDSNALQRLTPLAYGLISSPQAHAVHVIRLDDGPAQRYHLLVISHPNVATLFRQRLAHRKVITNPFGFDHPQTYTELTLELLGFGGLEFWIAVRMGSGWPGIMRQPDVAEPVIVDYTWPRDFSRLVRGWQGPPPNHLTFQVWSGQYGQFMEPR